jgi:hypothetical protein
MRHINQSLTLALLARIENYTKQNPIKIKALMLEFGIDKRAVESHIRLMRLSGHKIGCSRKEPKGIFKAKYPSEMIETIENIRQEGRERFHFANILADWGSATPTIFEQIEEEKEMVEING